MDGAILIKRNFSEIDQHLLSGRSIEYMVIDPTVILAGIYLTGIFEIMYIIAQCLFITGKAVIISVFYELLLEKIIDRGYTEVVANICLQDRDYSRSERLDVKYLVFGEFLAGIIRDHIHLVILGDGLAGWRGQPLIDKVLKYFGLGVPAKL